MDYPPFHGFSYFQVVLSNAAGECDSSAALTVIKPNVVKLVKGLEDVTVDEGQPMELSCKIDGTPKTVKWYKNGKEVEPDGQSFQLVSLPVSMDEFSALIRNRRI